MAPGNVEQDFVRFSKQSLIKRKTMKRDTYSVWERGCQEISKHFPLLKNGILDGFCVCVCVCVCMCVLAMGYRGALVHKKLVQRCWEHRADRTYYHQHSQALSFAESNLELVAVLFYWLISFQHTNYFFSIRKYKYIQLL